jgi:NAD(P)-dependent dehydrogenase (short-subunit alcohol dehydrogenase family)
MQKAIWVTGAGSGIGRATALRLERSGYALILTGRRELPLQETLSQMTTPSMHRLLPVDVSDRLEMHKGLCGLMDEGEYELVGVFANAGIGGPNQYSLDCKEDRWDEILSVNLTGAYVTLMEALPWLRRSREPVKHAVVTSSVLARFGVPGLTSYVASKAGLLGLVRGLAVEWGPEGILVNAVCPGWVETEMAKDSVARMAQSQGISYEDSLQAQCESQPMRRMSTPDEISNFVNWLMSNEQRSITGQALDINNGSWMG